MFYIYIYHVSYVQWILQLFWELILALKSLSVLNWSGELADENKYSKMAHRVPDWDDLLGHI